jgi:hypothetical protein
MLAVRAEGPPADVMSESRLRALYGVDVRILRGNDPESGEPLRACIPVVQPAENQAVNATSSQISPR